MKHLEDIRGLRLQLDKSGVEHTHWLLIRTLLLIAEILADQQ